jgi:hypothetical protein
MSNVTMFVRWFASSLNEKVNRDTAIRRENEISFVNKRDYGSENKRVGNYF